MAIKLNSIQEALKFRGRHTADGYIDCDGSNHGVIHARGCISGCMFQTGYYDSDKWGCYLLAERGMSKQEIFKTQLEMNRSDEICEWYCNNDSRSTDELGVREEVNRIAKKLGFEEKYHVSAPDKVGGTKDGCFIATAVYGDYEHPKVLVLREFRDRKLKNSFIGLAFIKTYYKISPPLAAYVRTRPFLLAKFRSAIDMIVALLMRR